MISVENADKALKDYYLEAVSNQLNQNVSPFFNAIEKSTKNVVGKDVKLTVIAGTNGSVAALGEEDDLPVPSSNNYLQLTVPLKNIYGTIEISDKALRASQGDGSVFVDLLNTEMDGLVQSAKSNFTRMIFGSAKGVVTRITDVNNNKSFEVEDVTFLHCGMKIDIYTGNNKVVDGARIAEVSGNTIGLAESAGTITTNGTVRVHGSTGKELTGLYDLFNGETLYGVQRSQYEYLSPAYYGDCETFSEEYFLTCIDDIESKFGKPDMLLCSYSMRRKIAKLITDEKRITNTTELDGGYTTITFNGIPVVADVNCPDGQIYILHTKDFCLHQLCDWEWLEDEGGKILKQVPGKAAYRATLVKYAELICSRPCAQGLIELS